MATRISTLIIKQLQGVITPRERKELEQFSAQSEENNNLVSKLTNHQTLLNELKQSYEWYREGDVPEYQNSPKGRLAKMRPYLRAVAVILFAAGLSWFIWDKMQTEKPAIVKENNRHPGPILNTLKTELGESRSIRLADGSVIWLNSASSVQYPVTFSGPERAVALLGGEGRFEIARDTSKPFRVRLREMEVEVIGTRFDISAYKTDSVVRTTLIKGKVKVKVGNDTLFLLPGEQALWARGEKLKKINVQNAAARSEGWKENIFKWVQADVKTMLGDISHWHGYNIKYKVNVPLDTYNVEISRSEPLINIFKVLHKATWLDFKLDGNTIVVYRDVNRRK